MEEPKPLELNGQLDYKDYWGTLEKMDELLKDGRTPLSISGIMERRIDVESNYGELHRSWWHYDFDTADVAIYNNEGRMKIVLDCDIIKELGDFKRDRMYNPYHDKYSFFGDKQRTWALVLPEDAWKKFEGREFSEGKEALIRRPFIPEKRVINNPIWRYLARDERLLEEYARITYILGRENKKLFGEKFKGMGITSSPVNRPGRDSLHLLLWTLSGVGIIQSSELYHPTLTNIGGGACGSIIGVKPR